MKKIIITLALLASVAQAGYRNIQTQASRDTLGGLWLPSANLSGPSLEQAMPEGWRWEASQPAAISNGYERLTGVRWVQDPGTASNCIPQYTDTLIQDRLDAEAAAEAARLEGWESYDRPVRAPSFEIAVSNHVYSIDVDPAEPDVLVIERESERLTNTEYAAIKASNRIARAEHRDRIAAIENDLNVVDLQITGTNWTDLVLTNITTTAGVWTNTTQRETMIAVKDALQAIKANDGNLKTAVRNLKQACEKIRREIR